jgi:hypothetical protein
MVPVAAIARVELFAAWELVVPLKLAALLFLPVAVQAEELDMVRLLLLPEESAARVPVPSLKLYEAMGVWEGGVVIVTVALPLAVLVPSVQERLKVVVLARAPLL